MPFATSERAAPDPLLSNTRTTISGEANDRPATPTPLLVAAPAIPDTWVPWPSGSVGIPAVHVEPRQVALEAEMRPWRSGFVASTPVSTIPTAPKGDGAKVPGKSDQPAGAAIVLSAHCEA